MPNKVRSRDVRQRFSHGKTRARRKKGLEWTITFAEYQRLVEYPCHYCNSPLSPSGVGLDRIDNSKGYTLENVFPCCGACNFIRGDSLTVEEMKLAIQAVLTHRKAR